MGFIGFDFQAEDANFSPAKYRNCAVHTNVQAQEENLPTNPRTEWTSTVLNQSVLSEDYLAHNVGIHTIEYEQDIQTIEYDAFHFVRRVCDLASCFDLSYDPRGHLIEIKDGTGLPTSIVWGWNGWAETQF